MKFRNEREKLLVQGGAVVAAILLWVGLILQPMLARIHRDEKALATSVGDLEKARRLAGTFVSLKATQGRKRTGTLVQEVERITRELGLQRGKQVVDLKVFGNNGVQLNLDDLDGPTLVRLLDALQKSSIRPDDLKMRDPKGQGLWTVTLTVKGSTSG